MIRGIITLVLLIAFIGVIVWAFSPRNRKRFEEDAKLPFAEEEKEEENNAEKKEETRDE